MRIRCALILVLSALALCAAYPAVAEVLPPGADAASAMAVSTPLVPAEEAALNAIFGLAEPLSLDPARDAVPRCTGTYLESTCESCQINKIRWCDVYSGGCKVCGPCSNFC